MYSRGSPFRAVASRTLWVYSETWLIGPYATGMIRSTCIDQSAIVFPNSVVLLNNACVIRPPLIGQASTCLVSSLISKLSFCFVFLQYSNMRYTTTKMVHTQLFYVALFYCMHYNRVGLRQTTGGLGMRLWNCTL